MHQPHPYADLQAELDELQTKDNLRILRALEKRQGPYVWIQNQRYLNLSSNDYLGLATNLPVQQEFLKLWTANVQDKDLGFSASSSRLLAGTHPAHVELERCLAAHYGREAALVFSSGYHANLGLLSALAGPNDMIFSDRLNHASLIDGIKLSGAKWHRYQHNNLEHLESLLIKYRGSARHAIILTESVFSMDGDCADLPGLVALKKKYDGWLYVDEAHALGVLGNRGLGLAEATQTMPDIDFLVGTFGKALAGLGAFVVADKLVVNYLINRARPFIFTTALPPMLTAWLLHLFTRLHGLQAKREHLATLAQQLRATLQAAGLQASGNSHIVPIVIGENAMALALANHLQTQGYLLYAIRPPTVPTGTSRLRISLTADIQWEDIQRIPDLLQTALHASRESTG